jgi:hypothetical protein
MLHIINVVHTEPNWWDGIYSGLDIGTKRFLERLGELGLRVPITWCAFFGNGHLIPGTGQEAPDLIVARPEFLAARSKLGDEIGIHVHSRRIFDTESYIAVNAKQLQAAGYPYPSTHAPYWGRLDPSVFRALAEAKIAIDTGLTPRVGKGVYEQHYDEDAYGRVLQDCTSRDPNDPASYYPYHPSYEDIAKSGNCPVLEIPVTFSYHGIESHIPWYLEETRKRWKARDEVKTDIIQFFWHPYEFLYPSTNSINHEVIDAFCTIFTEIATWDEVLFCTTREAAYAYR